MTTKQRFASIWDAIEDTPQEAASLRTRSGLMMSITEAIQQQGMTQAQAAVLFGVTQPRISDLMRGKVNLFSLDALVDMATTAGMAPTITVTMPKKPAPRTTARKTPPLAKPKASPKALHKTAA
ncbi:XRE family transcriptional regulator [Aquabacterium sp.]|uniref:helix-turn-helix domain-containing protein n=1 Tax=Aquabacterium sp. TaxID=1872578 RepID=UPI002486D5BA|nr:XRE family transcriptional regulator [Aquabacterium sp.]MDI1259586.1 XRE family transcriptional regulator [Aquabacterium sp.]